MADSYFIKRGEKVSGPFSAGQVKKLAKDGKFRDDDGVSNRQDGPWTPVAKAFKKQQEASHQESVTPEAETPATEPSETVQAPEEAEQIAEEALGITPESETPATEPSDAPRTRQCEDCGGVVSKRAAVCPHCGAPIVSDTEEQQQSPSADASASPMPVDVVTSYGTLTVSRKKKFDGVPYMSSITISCDAVQIAALRSGESADVQITEGVRNILFDTGTQQVHRQLNITAGQKVNLCIRYNWAKKLLVE